VSCRLETRQLPAPAAGSDWSAMLSGTDRVRIHAITAQLVTSATVANRVAGLIMKDQNGLTWWQADLESDQAASLTVGYSWAHGSGITAVPAAANGALLSAGLPRTWLEPGDTVGSVTAALQAGDQWSNIVIRFATAEHWEELQAWERLQNALGG
jgi:hypothetical protein